MRSVRVQLAESAGSPRGCRTFPEPGASGQLLRYGPGSCCELPFRLSGQAETTAGNARIEPRNPLLRVLPRDVVHRQGVASVNARIILLDCEPRSLTQFGSREIERLQRHSM